MLPRIAPFLSFALACAAAVLGAAPLKVTVVADDTRLDVERIAKAR